MSLLLLLACFTATDTADTAGASDSADTAEDSGDDTDTGNDACDTLSSGDDWKWDGACPQMPTPCDIVVTECSLAIDYEADGGMTMGMPYAGTIEGDTITFADGDSRTGCVGTIKGPDRVTGSCDGGCEFTLSR